LPPGRADLAAFIANALNAWRIATIRVGKLIPNP